MFPRVCVTGRAFLRRSALRLFRTQLRSLGGRSRHSERMKHTIVWNTRTAPGSAAPLPSPQRHCAFTRCLSAAPCVSPQLSSQHVVLIAALCKAGRAATVNLRLRFVRVASRLIGIAGPPQRGHP
jgi:hypothetical protein